MAKSSTAVATKAAAPAKAPSPKQELIAPNKSTELAVIGDEFAGMASGLENVTANDIIIPRIGILQALSPQLQKNKPEFIKGAAAGMFCDTATLELYEDELLVIPCFYAKVFLEWAPRASGKGLVHNHGTDATVLEKCTPDDKGRQVLANGNYIAETATYYVLNMSAGGRRSFIPMTSTQLKASRRWMTQITAEKLKRSNGVEFTPPIFFRSWKATPVEQSNAEGSWFGWKFEPGQNIMELDPTKSLLREAQEFYQQARDGLVRGDLNVEEEASSMQTVNTETM